MSAKTDESDPAWTYIADLSDETGHLEKYQIIIG